MTDRISVCELYGKLPELFAPVFEGATFPWEVLGRIAEFTAHLADAGYDGYTQLRPGVLVGRDVKIAPTAVIDGTAVIGHGSVLRPGAYLRGGVLVGESCVIGNSTELKNCIIMDHAQVPHYNYVGDSILGNKAHMGAGAVCSNLKADGKNVVIHGAADYDTGRRKVGAFLGDGADVGCGCVLSPGTVIGKGTSVYPLTHLRGVVPADSIVKAADKIVQKR